MMKIKQILLVLMVVCCMIQQSTAAHPATRSTRRPPTNLSWHGHFIRSYILYRAFVQSHIIKAAKSPLVSPKLMLKQKGKKWEHSKKWKYKGKKKKAKEQAK